MRKLERKMNTAYSYEIQPLDEHSISIERVYGTTPVVVIPEQIDGFTVKRIGAYCFRKANMFRQMPLPSAEWTVL